MLSILAEISFMTLTLLIEIHEVDTVEEHIHVLYVKILRLVEEPEDIVDSVFLLSWSPLPSKGLSRFVIMRIHLKEFILVC